MRVKKVLKGFDGFTRVFPEEDVRANGPGDIPRYFQTVEPNRDGDRLVGSFIGEGEDPAAYMIEPNRRLFRLRDFYIVAQYEEVRVPNRQSL